MFTETDILFAVYIAIPAYIANAFPIVFKGGPPIDLGLRFIDGERIFGSNKTFRGFGLGFACGILATLVEALLFNMNLISLGILVSLGALLGDLLGAFIKRRMNLKPGASFPPLDQLDFIFGALLLSYPVHPISLGTLVILVIFTPPFHLLANFLAYHLGIKKNWW